MSLKSKSAMCLALILAFSLLCGSASACTAIYVGSALTEEGATTFARSEDISNSYNKLMFVVPHGAHSAGETYAGCYGFTYTFTHDSYSFTCFSDDNQAGVDNICPDCGSDHAHTPYGAAGTNEMGVTVTATESIGGSKEVTAVDPYEDLGIEEAEIPTVLLSEAATAREAVDLLLAIYDEAGANAGSGIFIADNKECWYIENTTGHEYIALKLSDNLIFAQPNMSIIGKIDLDDENVIASSGLIEVAQQAGTFVGDADANVIDYVASYNAGKKANSRMISALNYFSATQQYTAEAAPDSAAYTISNVNADGEIVPFHTNIALEKKFSIADVQKYYQIEGIGSTGNLEIHLFQVYDEDSITDTVEWVAMDDGTISPFVPYYPMLTTDVYEGYTLSTQPAQFVTEQPESGLYYATTGRMKVDGQRVTVDGFKVLPENWADSYYWTMDALSNTLRFGGCTEDAVAEVKAALNAQQEAINTSFAQMAASVAAAETAQDAAKIATEESAALAAATHALAVELANKVLAQ